MRRVTQAELGIEHNVKGRDNLGGTKLNSRYEPDLTGLDFATLIDLLCIHLQERLYCRKQVNYCENSDNMELKVVVLWSCRRYTFQSNGCHITLADQICPSLHRLWTGATVCHQHETGDW